jgi:hypothetical protein
MRFSLLGVLLAVLLTGCGMGLPPSIAIGLNDNSTVARGQAITLTGNGPGSPIVTVSARVNGSEIGRKNVPIGEQALGEVVHTVFLPDNLPFGTHVLTAYVIDAAARGAQVSINVILPQPELPPAPTPNPTPTPDPDPAPAPEPIQPRITWTDAVPPGVSFWQNLNLRARVLNAVTITDHYFTVKNDSGTVTFDGIVDVNDPRQFFSVWNVETPEYGRYPSGEYEITAGVITSDGLTAEHTIKVNLIDVPTVDTVTISGPAAFTVDPGDVRQLSAVVERTGPAPTGLLWMTSNPSVVTVNSSGALTAVSAGVAYVTVVSAYDSSKSATVTVVVRGVTTVTVSGDQVRDLVVDDSLTLTASVTAFGGAGTGVTWFSTVEGVATVSPSGVVSAHAVGETRVRAVSVHDQSKFAEVLVRVSELVGE